LKKSGFQKIGGKWVTRNVHVYVLDERNQGLSQKVEYGNRIYRNSMDLREFAEHLGVKSAYYCGWSTGVSILYGSCLIVVAKFDHQGRDYSAAPAEEQATQKKRPDPPLFSLNPGSPLTLSGELKNREAPAEQPRRRAKSIEL
jgi:hypothetical protein